MAWVGLGWVDFRTRQAKNQEHKHEEDRGWAAGGVRRLLGRFIVYGGVHGGGASWQRHSVRRGPNTYHLPRQQLTLSVKDLLR